MKKVISCLVIAVMAIAFSAFGVQRDTYADDVKVTFKITNHDAEISARSSSDKESFLVGDTMPDVIVTYKNAVRAVVKLYSPDGAELKNEEYTLDLANENKTKLVDLSDIELEAGEYTVATFGYNVDDKETVGEELKIKVTEQVVPEIPDTGAAIFASAQELIQNNLFILVTSVATISILGFALKSRKGARK